MAEDLSDEEEIPWPPPPPPRPAKNFQVFAMDELIAQYPEEIFRGGMGPLPLFLAINVGFDPEDPDPFMYHYESYEVMFAYKEDSQSRVMMVDSEKRTLSLPLHSDLKFCIQGQKQEVTVADVVRKQTLPIKLSFARPECIDFYVDKQIRVPSYFGDVTLTSVYEEPFYWCLDVEDSGTVKDKPIVLPRNLHRVGFAPIVGVKGARDPASKIQEFVQSFLARIEKLPDTGDPFFQELAIVSCGPDPVAAPLKPYIDAGTFVEIVYKLRPQPPAPQHEAPTVPPRNPHPQSSKAGHAGTKKKKNRDADAYFSALDFEEAEKDEHVYNMPNDHLRFPVGVSNNNNNKNNGNSSDPSSRPPAPPPRDCDGSGGSYKQGASGGGDSDWSYETGDGSDGSFYSNNTQQGGGPPPPLPERSRHPQKTSTLPLSMTALGSGAPRPAVEPPDLTPLCVQDVCDKLKELGLGKHVKKFRKSGIDGLLLGRLSADTLRTDFKMKEVEVLLLQTFITEGHVPKRRPTTSRPTPPPL